MIATSSPESSCVTSEVVAPKLAVKVDRRGRVRVSKEQRRAILEKFERSGVSAAEFAKLTGLKYSTLAGWRQRYRRRQRLGTTPPLRLLEAVVEAGSPQEGGPASLMLRLAGDTRLELRDAKQIPLVAALIRALQKPC